MDAEVARLRVLNQDRVAARLAADGEFRLAARYWTGGLSFDLGDRTLRFTITDGRIAAGHQASAQAVGPGSIHLSAPAALWALILAPIPPPFFNDIFPARALGLAVEADPETLWQYYPAVQRAVQVLREEAQAHGAAV